MPSAIDICNRALAEIAGRVSINTFDDASPAAFACKLNYDPMRQMLIRCAPWNFTRKPITLTQVGTAALGTVPFPWMFSYAYPADCLKFRYMLEIPWGWPFPTTPTSPPQTGDTAFFPYFPASRRAPFLMSSDQDSHGNPRRVLLTNLCQAIGTYSYDCTDVSQFDSTFEEALVAVLAEKLVMPVTGNAGLKGTFIQLAKDRVLEARVADGNEGLPTTDHVPDWIGVRGIPSAYPFYPQYGGIMQGQWDSLSWGE